MTAEDEEEEQQQQQEEQGEEHEEKVWVCWVMFFVGMGYGLDTFDACRTEVIAVAGACIFLNCRCPMLRIVSTICVEDGRSCRHNDC